MRYLLVSVAIQALFALAPTAALACVCGVSVPPTRAERLASVRSQMASADAVFVGEFVSTDGQAVTLKVLRSWKGAADPTILLREPARRAGPDRIELDNCALAVGQGQYLVFASTSVGKVMYATKCQSGKVEEFTEVIGMLDEISRRKIPQKR